MKVYDSVKKEELEVDGTKGLIQLMRDGRQVDLYLKEKMDYTMRLKSTNLN